jgi:membrane-associated protease RseP (regulator of RpoE activity)
LERQELSLFGDWTPEDWLFLGAIAGLYWMLAILIGNSQFMKERGLTAWGPVIFWRTSRGQNLLDTLAKPKRLWRIMASAGVPLVILSMAYFLALVLLMGYLILRSPPEPSSYNAPRNILLIPGVNQFIPLIAWIGLFVTLLVHEFAHGILARVEGIKVKSMGLAFLGVPVAAFVEPDDEELFGTAEKPAIASRKARIRILAAGVISNFLVAAIAIALFFGPVIGAISPADRVVVADVQNGSVGDLAGFQQNMAVLKSNGTDIANLDQLNAELSAKSSNLRMLADGRERDLALKGDPIKCIMVVSVFKDSPAYNAGMPNRFVISAIDGQAIDSVDNFRSRMNSTAPGQNITIATNHGSYTVKLASKPDGTSLIGIGISGNALYVSGITFQEFPAEQFLAMLHNLPQRGINAFLAVYLALPFTGIAGQTSGGFQGFSGMLEYFFEPSGWAAPLGSNFFWIATILFWIGWINLYAGLFNCLPAVPLDGGHIFRDLIQASLERVVNVNRAEKLTRTVVAIFAWLIFASLIISVMAPYLAHGFSI